MAQKFEVRVVKGETWNPLAHSFVSFLRRLAFGLAIPDRFQALFNSRKEFFLNSTQKPACHPLLPITANTESANHLANASQSICDSAKFIELAARTIQLMLRRRMVSAFHLKWSFQHATKKCSVP